MQRHATALNIFKIKTPPGKEVLMVEDTGIEPA